MSLHTSEKWVFVCEQVPLCRWVWIQEHIWHVGYIQTVLLKRNNQ